MQVDQQTDRLNVAGGKSVTVLGATGSIGQSTLDVVISNQGGFRVEALTAIRSVDKLAAAARQTSARFAAIADPALYRELKDALVGTVTEAAAGPAALIEAAQRPADWVMAAIVGASGLEPTLAAVDRGVTIALANKECLVCAGSMFMERVRASGATVLPVDSEHNAVFQALTAGRRSDVWRVILTASGGPFRGWAREAIRRATPQQALQHPNWTMGPKITIDSATMMNKGLELIEAHHLFGLESRQLDVLVHPQSVVHGLVEYRDGSVVAQLGAPDMRIPIAHALAYPERIESKASRLDLARLGSLTFEPPDLARFPALKLARAAMEAGGSTPTVLNAANEVAVAEFLAGRISFGRIVDLVEDVLAVGTRQGLTRAAVNLQEVLAIDHSARKLTRDLLPEIAVKAT